MDKLPLDIVKCILSYDKRFIIRRGEIIQINKITKEDERYKLLLTIPQKQYDFVNHVIYVYMSINEIKDYLLCYTDFIIELNTIRYTGITVLQMDSCSYQIL